MKIIFFNRMYNPFLRSRYELTFRILDLLNNNQFDPALLIRVFYECLLSLQNDRISVSAGEKFVSDVVSLHASAFEIFLDTCLVFPVGSNPNINSCLRGLAQSIGNSQLLLLLEPAVLVDLDVANNMYEKRIIRTNTNLLYKQKRFNLLREESEGYSKLLVEMHLAGTQPLAKVKAPLVASTIESLIGYFDLDPLRSLDIILDVMSLYIEARYEVFLDILRHSAWWPKEEASSSDIAAQTGGNKTAAQIIGFKLKSFESHGIQVPEKYMMLIALLVEKGFIGFYQIYAFLLPDEKAFTAYEEKWRKDLDEQAYLATASALALAAPLTEDDDDSSTGKNFKNGSHANPNNKTSSDGNTSASATNYVCSLDESNPNRKPQKALFVECLLALGSIEAAFFILGKHPFMANAFTDIADLINRIASVKLDPLLSSIHADTGLDIRARPIPEKPLRQTELAVPGIPYRTPVLFPKDENLRVNHVFFYESWQNRITPSELTVESLISASELYFKLTGPLLARSTELYVKVCRFIMHTAQQESGDENRAYWYEYFRLYILPGIPVLSPNPGVISEVFNLLRLLTDGETERYALYGEWVAVLNKSIPVLKFTSSKAEKETKDVLKRLSKTNVKQMMRKMEKISYANPISCFTAFISQVESYDNLGDLVVEAARYFTDLGWDVMPYVIMTQLSAGRGTMQKDGLNDSKWLQSLSLFTAKLCKRYSNMSSHPLIVFLLKQLHTGNLNNVLLLRDLISQMAGITQFSNLSSQQVEMLGGGNHLRRIVFKTIDDNRDVSSRSALRLVDSLTKTGGLSELFIILCQMHKMYVFSSNIEPGSEKVMAHRYDELTHILNQYTELVQDFMEPVSFKQNMVSITDLCTKFSVSPAWAFGIWREVLSQEIRRNDASEPDSVFHPILLSIAGQAENFGAVCDWTYLDARFYVSFWQLSLFDIQYPAQSYEREEAKLRDQIKKLDLVAKDDHSGKRSELSKDNEKEKADLKAQLVAIELESKRHALLWNMSMARLNKEKLSWFTDENGSMRSLAARRHQTRAFLGSCILPRAIHSPLDAMFCARFIILLHEIGTPNFSCLTFFDKLFTDGVLYATLLTCTAYEAENLGLFFSEIFKKLQEWHQDELSFIEKSLGKKVKDDGSTVYLPGMMLFFDNPEDCNEEGYPTREQSLLNYDQFCQALEKWHRRTTQSIVDCLKNENYMHRRNTIIFLKNVNNVFPVINKQGWAISDEVELIAKTETRQDLKLSATAFVGHLTQRSKHWVSLYDFKTVSETVKLQLIQAEKNRESKAKANGIKSRADAKKVVQQKEAAAQGRSESSPENQSTPTPRSENQSRPVTDRRTNEKSRTSSAPSGPSGSSAPPAPANSRRAPLPPQSETMRLADRARHGPKDSRESALPARPRGYNDRGPANSTRKGPESSRNISSPSVSSGSRVPTGPGPSGRDDREWRRDGRDRDRSKGLPERSAHDLRDRGELVRGDTTRSDSGRSRDSRKRENEYSRDTNDRRTQLPPPPPPPPPPSPASSANGRRASGRADPRPDTRADDTAPSRGPAKPSNQRYDSRQDTRGPRASGSQRGTVSGQRSDGPYNSRRSAGAPPPPPPPPPPTGPRSSNQDNKTDDGGRNRGRNNRQNQGRKRESDGGSDRADGKRLRRG